MTHTLRTLAVAAVAGLVAGPAVPAADPAVIADVALARAALTAVDADPVLKDAQLVVSVVDRVAVVGGPVASAEVGRRAEEVVRAVPGVASVKNRCFVQAGPDPLIRPTQDYPSLLPRRLAADLPGVVSPARPLPTAADDRPPPGRTVVTLRPADPVAGLLGPPVGAVPAAGPTPGPYTPPAPPAPGVLTARPGGVLGAAEAARKADPRFANLTLDLKDGTVVIGGTAARAADAWDLAQNLRTVPGVTRVAVGAVGVK